MKVHKIFNDERGVTLIEVLLVAVTGGFLLTSLSVASGLFLTSYSATMDNQDLTLAHHIAMERVLRTVTAAEEIELPSSTTLTAMMPDGGTEQFTWSGTGGDPMYLYRDDLDGVAFVDGVTNLSFAATMANSYIEEPQTVTEEILSFSSYSGYSQDWDDYTLGTTCQYGLTFKVPYDVAVEQIVLTRIEVLIAKLPTQTEDMNIILMEGLNEELPRPWGDVLATVEIDNADITNAYWDGDEWVIGWSTFDLPEDFIILANRWYCLLFETAGAQEAATLRVAEINGSSGPENGMVFVGTDDGGASWDPPLSGNEKYLRDVPVSLTGDVYTYIRTPYTYVESVEVNLGLTLGDATEFGSGKARVRGKSY